jgi:tetratricopeptide (TPR) repeat protein
MVKPKMLAMAGILILITVSKIFAGTEKSDSLVAEAWKAWGENNHRQVEEKFLSAIKEDRNNTRAYMGLSFLYALQRKDKESWDVFKNVMQTEQNPYPYIYAAMFTPRMRRNQDNRSSGIISLLEKLSESADSGGVVKAMANEMLGEYYQQKGDLVKARRYFQNLNAIKDWTVIGPFENISASGLEKVYPPELEYEPSKTYLAKGGIPAKWFRLPAIKNSYWIDFLYYFAHTESIFYANNFVFSPKKQMVQIRIGTSGSLRTFLNDELIVESADETNNDLDTFIVETELQEGWNRLLVKCGYSEISSCNFLTRITDERGEAIKGLEISTDTKPYKSRPGAISKTIENFAEAFFRAGIKQNPALLENSILLADCYLRNDKATEAELVLREAIKLSPNCALLYRYMLDAYSRGKKYDETITTLEKIYTIDKNIPDALEYRISESLKKQEYDKAEELIKDLEKLMPGSERVYELYLGLYGNKQQVDKIIEINKKAYKQYPANWYFVFVEATISIETTRKFDHAIDLVEGFLNKQYTDVALITLAGLYLKSSNLKKWQETYDRLFELEPASTDFYYQMSNTYSALQDYENAEKRIKKAIDLCPNSSVYWSKLGEIYRIKNQIALSKQAYLEALNYNPADYDARRALRELEGKRSVFSLFETTDIKDLMKNSPDAKAFPDSGGIILLHDTRRVVYERGASESSEELLVKIFNKRGMDDFKEYWINFNPHTEVLTVEQAIVIKNNGSEIKADIEDNHIVFKTLEENDHIYLKWGIKNYYTGSLSGDFWDTQYFNGLYPIKNIRYSLLVPRGFKYQTSTQNMPSEPSKRQTEDGLIYRWSLTDEPAMEYEYAMPVLEDVGKILYISSIDNWETIVNWYSDLAQTKARSSFEIKEQVEKLFSERKNPSEEEKVETIYNFVTENIRYSNVSFRQSGLIPQKARDVLVNRIGDCKDMATLCIAMLGEVGIKAHYVLVNTRDNGQNINGLPSIAFNHCMVAVETKSGLKYLDLTAYNYPLNSVPQLDTEAFSLLIKPGVKFTEYLPKDRFTSRTITRQSKVGIQENMSISVQHKSSAQGAAGATIRYYYRNKGQKEREKTLMEALGRSFSGVKLNRFEMEGVDALNSIVNLSYNFDVPNYITQAGQFKLLRVPWTDTFRNNEGLSYDNRKFSYYYWPEADRLVEEIEINLPAGYEPLDLIKEIKYSSSVADYSIGYSFSNGVIRGRRELINKKAIVSPSEYSEFKKFFTDVLKEDERQILLKAK